ncbi:MAG: helix-turn-helix transcriptional regulator [Candidatus Bathyarchaeota archaeon]
MSEIDKVREALKQNPGGLPVTKIAELTGLSRTKTTKILKELETKNEVEVEVKGCRKTYKSKRS